MQISSEAKDLIIKMLKKNPNERITAVLALEHPWIKNKDNMSINY